MTSVMLVDDEPLMRKGLHSLVNWESMGCQVVAICENGQQAIDIYNNSPPDIIVSDIKMPLVDGISLAKYVFENGRASKIILLTAFADFSFAQSAITFGVTEYVTKTGYMDELTQAVIKCIQQLKTESKMSKPKENAAMLLCKIVTGVVFSREEIDTQLREAKIALPSFRLCVCDITQLDEVRDDEFIQLRAHATRLLEQAFAEQGGYILPLSKNTLGVVAPRCNENELLAQCKDITGIFTAITKKLIFIGISGEGRDGHSLNSAYLEAKKALDLSFFDKQAVHMFNLLPSPSKHNSSMLTDEISDALRSADNDACLAILDRFFASQRLTCTDADEVREQAMLMLNACCGVLAKVGSEPDDLSYSKAEWRSFIFHAKSFDNICSILKDLVADTCRIVAWFKNMTGDITSVAYKYIEEHFCENITLSDIAAHVNVHPGYLSRLFKQKTGLSITDTITKLRINKAKALLKENAMLVSEVGEAVGFNDITYFSYVFRKQTGVAPSKWLVNERLPK